MNQQIRLHIERFDQELESYRLFVIQNKELLKRNPWLERQITFWTESARFLIAELEIWNDLGDHAKCNEVIVRAQKALNRLYKLIGQLKMQNNE